MSDLRALLGDRYVETLRAAVLADSPNAIKDAQRVGGNLGELMYLSAVDRLHRVLAAVLPDLLARAWDEGAKDACADPYHPYGECEPTHVNPYLPVYPYRTTEGDPS